MAALSIESVQPWGTTARVIGDLDETEVEWIVGHLRELEGDVTLELEQSIVRDYAAVRMLTEFAEYLRNRGNRLAVVGLRHLPARRVRRYRERSLTR